MHALDAIISFFTNSLVTKVANFHGPNGEINFPSKPKYVRQYHKDSLKRLEVDCIDLYCQHRMTHNM
uniref:NADP-dependent oxidoreductase domain-containing protein n=1 Tax=Rhizophagus irregularis (strain DAOM 181602 / DAOM 197198 / MUCL 43194) TaxID=747089 RepID=U9TB37_RHIID